jgi:hypothetical protein
MMFTDLSSTVDSAEIAKPLMIIVYNTQIPKRQCHDRRTWISDKWESVLKSDASPSTMIFPTPGRAYIW